jgi:biotin-[acetyl-CoA-carboxylase] ligase BirA-like protein
MNWRIHRFPILASTNDLALSWMRVGQATAGDVLVAEEQTSGRGRHGRSWISARGALLFTAVLPLPPERLGWTALAAGVATARAVRELGVPAQVKWPNDVLVAGRKLAGILVETSNPHLVAVGVGLNVSNPLPDDPAIAARATRLLETRPDATPEAVLETVLSHLSVAWDWLDAPDLVPLRQAWDELDVTRGRRVQLEQGVIGTALGVDEEGALRVRGSNGQIIAARVGEVQVLPD